MSYDHSRHVKLHISNPRLLNLTTLDDVVGGLEVKSLSPRQTPHFNPSFIQVSRHCVTWRAVFILALVLGMDPAAAAEHSKALALAEATPRWGSAR
jgi:predicted ATP-dependent Lon-type protease